MTPTGNHFPLGKVNTSWDFFFYKKHWPGKVLSSGFKRLHGSHPGIVITNALSILAANSTTTMQSTKVLRHPFLKLPLFTVKSLLYVHQLPRGGGCKSQEISIMPCRACSDRVAGREQYIRNKTLISSRCLLRWSILCNLSKSGLGEHFSRRVTLFLWYCVGGQGKMLIYFSNLF